MSPHTTENEHGKALAAQLLHGFDIENEQSREFLQLLVAAGNVPRDALAELTALGLARGEEEWDMMVGCATSIRDRVGHLGPEEPGRTAGRTKKTQSPFFVRPSAMRSPKRRRPPAGTVSSLPIPPLSAARFGLIQEELAHDPFWLLVAVRFLVKTAGRAAIPAFRALKARFPTPEALAAADADADVMPMIHHLGLSAMRCAAIQHYARAWVARPPCAAVRFAVKNYPRPGDGQGVRAREEFGPETLDADAYADTAETGQLGRARECAWEIGHITQGRYTIDSWRIFCRDIMLGRAADWMGTGAWTGAAQEGFQPEWMRVVPEDKELRACLRWMWMREGWLWDAVTGEREVLAEDMRQAVDEDRVGYDDTGNLVILQHHS